MTYLQRKKLAFMNIVNGIKGFVRTISGVPPLTLPGCVDVESVIDYTIAGASGGVGDATENLFDNTRNWSGKGPDAISAYGASNATKIDGGGYHMTYCDSILFKFTNLTVGEKYTISWDVTPLMAGQNICLISAPNVYQHNYAYTKNVAVRFSQTFTATATTNIAFGFVNNTNNDGTADITNIMLVPGSTAKTYEPYGYRLPVVCGGKNLLDLPYTTNNRLVSAKNLQAEFSFPVEIGKTYTFRFSATFTNLTGSSLSWCLSYVNEYQSASQNHIAVSVAKNYNCYFTATAETVYFIGGVNGAQQYWNFQLEESPRATAYEPYAEPTTTNIYLDAPLEEGEVINDKEDNLPTLPTVQGTTIYTVDTAVQPSNMSVTYYSNQKG